nr:MAG TPA: Disulfide bond isomerase protein N-terminus [Caudoviricetes sp.]
MQKGDMILARFMTLPDLFPGKGCEERKFPIRKGTVVYVHPKGRYIVAECGGGVRETFFPEEVLI